MTDSKSTSIRWWPLIAIWLLAIIAWAYIGFTGDLTRQFVVMKSIATGIVAGALSMLWLLTLSRLPWMLRLKGLGAAVLGLVVVVCLFRIEGVSGDLMPIVKWRWSSADEKVTTGLGDASQEVKGSYSQFL